MPAGQHYTETPRRLIGPANLAVAPLQALDISQDCCDLWRVDLDAGAARSARIDVLNEAERGRAARLRFERDRERFATCRAALQVILGHYLRCEPARLRFRVGEHSKPYLDSNVPIKFNVAHSADLALIAVAREGPLGVDLKAVREIENPLELAERYFDAEECQVVVAASAPNLAFLTCWTRKEAVLKSIGAGLTCDTRRIHVGASSEEKVLTLSGGAHDETVRLQSLAEAQGYVAACACREQCGSHDPCDDISSSFCDKSFVWGCPSSVQYRRWQL